MRTGFEVTYVYGTDRFVPADLVLVHVDLSVVPAEYPEFAAQYPIVLNARIRDIRKTATSRYLVRRGDAWSGPVKALDSTSAEVVVPPAAARAWREELGLD